MRLFLNLDNQIYVKDLKIIIFNRQVIKISNIIVQIDLRIIERVLE